MDCQALLPKAGDGAHLGGRELAVLACDASLEELMAAAARRRDAQHGVLISYSRKVFLPLTHLCRDVCRYCVFARPPSKMAAPYLRLEEVLEVARRGERMGCREALFTLGERPELRYPQARAALDEMGFGSTLEYVAHCAQKVLQETRLLPHINAGCMDASELAMLRRTAPSMGLMLESAAKRLCDKGGPHHGCPDKLPARRLAVIEEAGRQRVPFTSGILIGIGETRRERLQALLLLRAAAERYGHLQEILVQNFRAKPGTRMVHAAEPSVEELLWTIALARLVFAPEMSIQAPPNLSPGQLQHLVAAGLNDWGGVSPLTPDYVNPEAPWPHLETLRAETARAGKFLQERLTVYPSYVRDGYRWIDRGVHARVLRNADSEGFARGCEWRAGGQLAPSGEEIRKLSPAVQPSLRGLVRRAMAGHRLAEKEIYSLFSARGEDFRYLCQAADALREQCRGAAVSYVINRNINYTNICTYKCRFCAFSKGKRSAELRGPAYDLPLEEIALRTRQARDKGATEICLQGGIHPSYTGERYLEICRTVKRAAADIHVHAFSPLEIWQGAATLGISLREFLGELRRAGLGSLPGTAAEILDDEVRERICADKIRTDQWLEVMRTAHEVGLRSTATIMFGHLETAWHWARHLLRVRTLQEESGGFTEFVPLPFVHMEAPMYLRGEARPGPTFREAVLMHAVARLTLYPAIKNIQASWVKLGLEGVRHCLHAGVNDLGGTLMNESITRAAGASHGQEMAPAILEKLIHEEGRQPWQRTTLYRTASSGALALSAVS